MFPLSVNSLSQCLVSPTSYSASQCYFEAYVRKHVFEAADMHDTSYLPKQSDWSRCAPCENDTTYLHRVIQCENLNFSSCNHVHTIEKALHDFFNPEFKYPNIIL